MSTCYLKLCHRFVTSRNSTCRVYDAQGQRCYHLW